MNSTIDTISTLKFKELKEYAKTHEMRGYSRYTSKATLSAFIISNVTDATDAITDITNALNTTAITNDSGTITEKLSHINVLDLFSGCGGMTYGFDKRFNVVCGIDVWDKAIESYNANYEHLGICRDLTSYPPEQCDAEHINGSRIDIIVGGPPCQSYSMDGKRDPNDPRANLFLEYCKYLQYFNPKVFVMENVIGILSVKDRDNNLVIDKIMGVLSEKYNCMINKLHSCDFEVPQLRRRVIIMGIRKDLNILPESIIPINPDNRIPVRTVLQDRKDVSVSNLLSERAIAGINAKRERMRNESKGYGAQFLNLDQPSYTIPARYWKDGYDTLARYSDTEIRRLTILELKRIQTFPDDYILIGTKKEQIMQIGNAVACKFGYHIANHVANTFLQL